jgi:uncharacterized protein
MAERTKHEAGTFSWVDLGTPDPDSAKSFYAGLFGWEFEDLPVGDDGVYTMCRVDSKDVCAIARQSEQERGQGVPPHWNNYVTVNDIEAQAPQIGELNGNLILPPFDVLEAGRMALGSDPTGGVFALWEPRNHIGAGLVNAPGALAWNELATADKDAAEKFYGALFGWTFDELGDSPIPYALIKNGDRSNGGIRAQGDAEKGAPSYWAPYFGVASSDESAAQATKLGGQVVVPTTRMPAGAFAGITDPQGAFFLVFEGDFDD